MKYLLVIFLILLNLFISSQFQATFKGQTKVDLDVFALPAVCQLELEPGSCRNKKWRWYYNADVRECQAFAYNGCHGNGNNFVTKSACENTCRSICNADNLISPCLMNETRWVYDPTSNTCKQMSYGGCQGHGNRFNTHKACLAKCKTGNEVNVQDDERCDLQWDKGVSNDISATTKFWYYDKLEDECFTFTYLGTGGNKNRFKRRLECVQYCKERLTKKGRCEDSAEYGNCGAKQLRWYHDGAECRPFHYSGCGGNFNNFANLPECMSECSGKNENEIELFLKNQKLSCLIPPETGECRADITRWFYDPIISICQTFRWGGCPVTQLPENNFESADQCQLTCGRSASGVTKYSEEGRSNFPRKQQNVLKSRGCKSADLFSRPLLTRFLLLTTFANYFFSN